MEILKKNWLILAILLLIFSARIVVFNKDAANFWADERHFTEMINKLEESKEKNDYTIALRSSFHLNARPGLGVFYFPAAFFQWKNPTVPFGAYFNLIINSGILVLIYLILSLAFNKKTAILGLFLAFFSTSSIIYLRHLLPYDMSFFILLLGLFIYLKTKKSFLFGVLSGLSFLTYATYYYILPIPLILLFYFRSIRPILSFLIGIIAILFLTNMAYIAFDDSSYFQSLKQESGGVTSVHIGDYVPAFSFIGQYILTVDGIWNLSLIIVAFLLMFLKQRDKKIISIGIYIFLVFLIMEITSHFLQMHVLYGRTVRPLYLTTLIFAGIVFAKSLSKRIILLLLFISFINWLPHFLTFKNLIYPPQFKQQAKEYVLSEYGEKAKIEDLLFVNYFSLDSPPKMKIFKEFKDAVAGTFYIVNANVIYPYYGSYDLKLYCDAEILLKIPHVQTQFRPYLFEGWGEVMRQQSIKDPLNYQLIYCK